MDAAELIKNDHRKVEALFERYQSGEPSVVAQICDELKVHTAIEEGVLYPALSDVEGGAELRREAEEEHREVKEAIAAIEGADEESSDIEANMRTIIDGVTRHVEEEENEVLPKMQSGLGKERMEQLGAELLEAKREELLSSGIIMELTKDELYEMAQEVDIEGRSDMTKDQLIEALRD